MIVWHLNMPMKTKALLSALLMLSVLYVEPTPHGCSSLTVGSSALGASIVKAIEIKNLSFRNDFTWNMVALQMWVVVENNVVMIAASIPTLRALVRKDEETNGVYYRSGPSAYIETSFKGAAQTTQAIEPQRWRAGDGASEEYILEELRDDRITKTTDVHVEYHIAEAGHGGPLPHFLRSSRTPHEMDMQQAV